MITIAGGILLAVIALAIIPVIADATLFFLRWLVVGVFLLLVLSWVRGCA